MLEQINGGKNIFRKQTKKSDPTRIFLMILVILMGLLLYREVNTGAVEPLFMPTPYPTRTANSYTVEGESNFIAGKLDKAVESYRKAAELDPTNAEILAELARIQVYSSSLLTTDQERKTRLEDALASIDQAVEIDPESSNAHAIRALVLDWYANPILVGDEYKNLLLDAERDVTQALQIDNSNVLALAYNAEILIDQQRWAQAEQFIQQAMDRDTSLMDVHRIYAYYLESTQNYSLAIDEYKKAAEITPNLTFLYISIGKNYRHLGDYDTALEYFEKAADINEQINVKDPIPYNEISKTYSQTGDFFSASRNALKALVYNPTGPDSYGRLGIVYFKSRNYEGSILAFQCAIRGCDADLSCEVRKCDSETDPKIEIQGLPLTDNTLVYYYSYGSVLSAMHQKSNNYCEEAMRIFGEVEAIYGADPTVMSIVNPGKAICESYGYTLP